MNKLKLKHSMKLGRGITMGKPTGFLEIERQAGC